MAIDYRAALLAIVAHLDQLQNDTEAILAQPVYSDVGARAEELRELIIEVQELVEEMAMREVHSMISLASFPTGNGQRSNLRLNWAGTATAVVIRTLVVGPGR